jgi:hypothetical protein
MLHGLSLYAGNSAGVTFNPQPIRAAGRHEIGLKPAFVAGMPVRPMAR